MKQENYSRPLDLKNVVVTDEFWGREQELVRREVIPYQWEALNDRVPGAAPSFCMRNFKVAGKMMRKKREQGAGFAAPVYTFRGFEALPEDPEHPDPDRFYGFVFQDSDFAKWIEAVGYSLASHPDEELERTADEAIDIVCAAQAENGYLDTYYIINGMDRIFTNLRDHHELYCFGHLAEGAVSYYQATGKDKLLKAAERYADFICSRFGYEEGKCKGYPGHEIAEMALARLYELTGKERYLELGRFFLEMRGTKPYYFDIEDRERAEHEGRPWKAPDGESEKDAAEGAAEDAPEVSRQKLRFHYHQAHLPVRKQSEAVGHAVRGVYLYSGMADVARLTDDEELFAACERLWNSIVNEKLYITGGIGGTHIGEAFSYPYDLPNDTAYSETCAAIGLAFFARRMLEIQADSRYGDVMEQALYNTVLAGMALDGRSFFYVNPLEAVPEGCLKDERKRHVKTVRQKWFGCACCPPNIARIVSSIGAYVYTAGQDTLYTHLYVGSRAGFTLNGRPVDMQLESGFPWEGKVRAVLHLEETEGADGTKTVQGTLAFRVPGWCRSMTAEVRDAAAGGRTVADCHIAVREEGSGAGLVSLGTPIDAAALLGQKSDEKVREMRIRLERGYLYLTGEWRDGDEIYIDIPMEVRCVSANTRVREDIGRAAFLRGPVCYCMEEADNGSGLHLLRADMKKAAQGNMRQAAGASSESMQQSAGPAQDMARQAAGEGEPGQLGELPVSVGGLPACRPQTEPWQEPLLPGVEVAVSRELGHEMRVLKVPGFRQEPSIEEAPLYGAYTPPREKETTLTFVPYYAWNNRGEGEMSVWVRG